jgi:DNA transformation protein
MSTTSLRNIGPKSAAWLRQIGLHSAQALAEVGSVQAFARIKRAGFKPSLNLLYSLEGALMDCHWHDVPESRRQVLLNELEAITAAQPAPRGRPAAGPVTTRFERSESISTQDEAAQNDSLQMDGTINRFD